MDDMFSTTSRICPDYGLQDLSQARTSCLRRLPILYINTRRSGTVGEVEQEEEFMWPGTENLEVNKSCTSQSLYAVCKD
jgi:hypothetical protein